MEIYPAIDLFEGKAVRLYQGDYAQMTVYSEAPPEVAGAFVHAGATHIHIVDLEGAKTGVTPNFETVCAIRSNSGVFCQVGGGIRSMEVVERCLAAGLDRVILGTAALTDEAFLRQALDRFGRQIAVGVDIKNGYVAIRGWTESSSVDAFSFCEKMQKLGVQTLVCTDISRDGAMRGTNQSLYERLGTEFKLDIIASGGVSSLYDIQHLAQMGLHGAIIGKAYYTGAIDLREAIKTAREATP